MNERIYIPVGNVLLKADESSDDIIYLEASNEMSDLQGDTMLQKALKDQAESFMKSGVISFDHQHKIKNDPNFIIGEPLDVKFPAGITLVKARLYLTNHYAQGVMAMAKAGSTRLGASVGGWIKERIKKVDDLTKSVRNYITQVVWDETAITYKPVNDVTLGGVTIMQPEAFAKSFAMIGTPLYKALMAGAGTDAAAMTGGRAIIPEDLEGGRGKRQKAIADVMKMVLAGEVENHKKLDEVMLAHGVPKALKPRIMAFAINKGAK